MAELEKQGELQGVLIHTGQHYDSNMSDVFFSDLNIPVPDVHLGIGSGTHAEQTGKLMIAFERLCMDERPDIVLVVGDVNATVACSLVAAKSSRDYRTNTFSGEVIQTTSKYFFQIR